MKQSERKKQKIDLHQKRNAIQNPFLYQASMFKTFFQHLQLKHSWNITDSINLHGEKSVWWRNKWKQLSGISTKLKKI